LKVLGAAVLLNCVALNTSHAQFNTSGFIHSGGWNYALCFANPFGAGPAPSIMKQNWVLPFVIGEEDPASGDNWDVDFNGDDPANPCPGINLGGLAPPGAEVFWFTIADFVAAYSPTGITVGNFIDGCCGGDNRINYQDNFVNPINSIVVANTPGATNLPGDNVMAMATTYVDNVSGGGLLVDVCSGSDDSIQVWINNKCVTNVSRPRGYGGGCQEINSGILPVGTSKIATLVWEGGGGWNKGLGLQLAGTGVNLADGNGMIDFIGPAGGETQEQYCVDRNAALDEFFCNTEVTWTVQGAGGGPDGDVTVCEFVRPADANISDISHGGTAADHFVQLSQLANGMVMDMLVLGPINQAGGSGHAPGDARIRMDYITDSADPATGQATDKGATYTECSVNPKAGDTVTPDFANHPHGNGFQAAALDGTWRAVHSDEADPNQPGINFNSIGGAGDQIMHYTVFYLKPANDGDIKIGAGSDDSVQVTIRALDDDECTEVILFNGGRGWCGGACDQNRSGPIAVTGGTVYRVMTKTYEGGGGHGVKVRLFDGADNVLTSDDVMVSIDCENFGPRERLDAQKITWEVSGATLDDEGVSYTVSGGSGASASGAVNDSDGNPIAIVGRTAVGFVRNPTGPIGTFDNAITTGNASIGETTYDDKTGSYTQSANGEDIWNAGDHMQFSYKKVTGDFVATMNVTNRIDPECCARWGKHGVMARYNCNFNAAYSQTQTHLATGNDGEIDIARHQYRRDNNTNGSSRDNRHVIDDGTLPGTPIPDDINNTKLTRRPDWLRMVRKGNTNYSYMAWSDPDTGEPVEWCRMGSDTDPNRPDTLLVGVALTAHSGGGGAGPTGTVEYTFELESLVKKDISSVIEDGILAVDFEDANKDGSPAVGEVVQRGGGHAPHVHDGWMRLTQNGAGGSATAYWLVAENGANPGEELNPTAGLGGSGFICSFDVRMSAVNDGYACDPAADPNPADGMSFAVVQTNGDAYQPFAPNKDIAAAINGLDIRSLCGDGGGALGYEGGTIRQRAECHPSFAVELDNWNGGGDRATDGNQGSPGNDCAWHVGVDVDGEVTSAQTSHSKDPNVALPSIWTEAGVQMTVQYQPSGMVNVWIADNNDPGAEAIHALCVNIDPLGDDIIMGWTGGTGGATATMEVDNFVVASLCTECTDTVSIVGWSEDGPQEIGVGEGTTHSLDFGGIDPDANFLSASIAFASDPADIIDVSINQETGEFTVTCLAEGAGAFQIQDAGDDICGADAVSDICEFVCVRTAVSLVACDYNGSGVFDLSDGIALLNNLFLGGAASQCGEVTDAPAIALLDANGSGAIDLSDAVYKFSYLFLGGPEPVGADADGCVAVEDCERDPDCVAAP